MGNVMIFMMGMRKKQNTPHESNGLRQYDRICRTGFQLKDQMQLRQARVFVQFISLMGANRKSGICLCALDFHKVI